MIMLANNIFIGEGKPENEAKVSWSKYQADHVLPHSKGGKTDIG